MTWKKLKDFPNQKYVGVYQIEFWAIRDSTVFHQGRKIKTPPDEIEIWEGHSFIARDKQTVFFGWSKTKIDPNTLRPYHEWWLDKDGVYTEGESNLYPIKGIESASFEWLGGAYAKDARHAVYSNRIMKSCHNPNKLQVIEELNVYAKDDENVYYEGGVVTGANVNTWRLLPDNFSTDGKNVYWVGRKLAYANYEKWTPISNGISKSNKYVYDLAWIIKGADPNEWDITKVKQYKSKS